MARLIFTTALAILIHLSGTAQQLSSGWEEVYRSVKGQNAPFCIKNTKENLQFLSKNKIEVKYSTENWLFFTANTDFVNREFQNHNSNGIYYERSYPSLLNDSARGIHHVDQVHNGIGLNMPYKGDGVIIGYVDTGIDWNHPDFQDENGNTRVIRYWDHTKLSGGPIAQPYNYGVVWDSSYINAGTCTSTDNHSHGTTVAGAGSGNGRATGYNQGMAPNSTIIIVETDLAGPNWSFDIADACDYIFKVADTLGMPAVINLSLGDYFGSHDGNDPAAEYIESLLDAKDGRIVISAAGNSGNFGKYHCGSHVDADTSFVWFDFNPSASNGPRSIVFELWTDLDSANFDYAWAANLPGSYEFRGRTNFYNVLATANSAIIDTLWSTEGNRLATFEMYNDVFGNRIRLFGGISYADSNAYNFRFETTGNGRFDLWSGTAFGFNNMKTSLPSPAEMPEIIHYVLPDSLQTIVTSWNCSEKVVSVGNVHNRQQYIDYNLNPQSQVPPNNTGRISINSSKGPNRSQVQKPNVTAVGDFTLSAGPLWFLSNPANYNKLDSGGWHMRNGGTSMASPIVAGIAALYLERCDKGNYQDFIDLITETSMSNSYTGSLPNYAYGYGLINAEDLMLRNNFNATITSLSGTLDKCDTLSLEVVSDSLLSTAIWSNDFEGLINIVSTEADYWARAYNLYGCPAQSDTVHVNQLIVETIDPIIVNGSLLSTTSSNSQYQWTYNGSDLPGENNDSVFVEPPYGDYTCYTVSIDGCISETDPVSVLLELGQLNEDEVIIFPNPTKDLITIKSASSIKNLSLLDIHGNLLPNRLEGNSSISLKNIPAGMYFLKIECEQVTYSVKIIKE